MTHRQLELWAEETSEEGRLLSRQELKPILQQAGEKLLKQASYEPIGDRGSVYKRTSDAPAATIR